MSQSGKFRETPVGGVGLHPSVLRRLRKSLARRWEFVKHKAYAPLADMVVGEYRSADALFGDGRSFKLDDWVFHDENWIRVQHRKEHRRLLAAGKPLNVSDNRQEPTEDITVTKAGDLDIDARATSDRWIYLYLDPRRHAWDNYSWSFTVCRHTCFRELQFGFRYQDFYNRYRYRFEADQIFFDKVVMGGFVNALSATPFHMTLGTAYNVRIDAWRNHFRCYVDGVLMSSDHDLDNRFPLGSIALILWEDDGVTDIRASIGSMSVRRLVK